MNTNSALKICNLDDVDNNNSNDNALKNFDFDDDEEDNNALKIVFSKMMMITIRLSVI